MPRDEYKGLLQVMSTPCNIPALAWIMAWRRPGDKPLSEPMLVYWPQINDADNVANGNAAFKSKLCNHWLKCFIFLSVSWCFSEAVPRCACGQYGGLSWCEMVICISHLGCHRIIFPKWKLCTCFFFFFLFFLFRNGIFSLPRDIQHEHIPIEAEWRRYGSVI